MKTKLQASDHTFVICAYGYSEYLEECLKSLESQDTKTKIIIATSTPLPEILKIGEKHHVDVVVNTKSGQGIAADWNFAYHAAQTELVTIAHQDDLYGREYTSEIIKVANKREDILILFSDYGEIRQNKSIKTNRNLQIKRMMLMPLKISCFQRSIWVRRRILSFGNAICCPSVTYHRSNLPKQLFETGLKSNIDWQAWEKLSRRKGAFVYCGKSLMYHRIHEDSTTTSIIDGNIRQEEDLEVLRKFWPEWMAKGIEFFYQKSEKSNRIG